MLICMCDHSSGKCRRGNTMGVFSFKDQLPPRAPKASIKPLSCYISKQEATVKITTTCDEPASKFPSAARCLAEWEEPWGPILWQGSFARRVGRWGQGRSGLQWSPGGRGFPKMPCFAGVCVPASAALPPATRALLSREWL